MKKFLLVSCLTALIFTACSIKDNKIAESDKVDVKMVNSLFFTSDNNYSDSGLIIFHDTNCNYSGDAHYDKKEQRVYVSLTHKDCIYNNQKITSVINGYAIENGIKGLKPIIEQTISTLNVSLPLKPVSLIINKEP